MNIYRLSFVSCLVMAMPSAVAVEFNLNVLDKSMRDRIDISLLKEKVSLFPVNILLALQQIITKSVMGKN